MEIRIYETDFEGHPVKCTGEYFAGPTALAIVKAMKLDPFNASFSTVEFMRGMLERIGETDFVLPEKPEEAADVFLGLLTVLGYAGNGSESHNAIDKKASF